MGRIWEGIRRNAPYPDRATEKCDRPGVRALGHRRGGRRRRLDLRDAGVPADGDAGRRPGASGFYSGDFSLVCIEELCSLQDLQFEAIDRSTAPYGVSRDSLFTHEGFAYEHDLQFPLSSDVEGEVCRDYTPSTRRTSRGADVEAGLPKRTLYVVDDDRTIRYARRTEDPYEQPDLGPAVGTLSAD